MRRYVFQGFIACTCLGVSLAQGQPPADSVAIASALWQIKTVGPGVVWKQFHFAEKQLFNANQNINILETRLKNRRVRFGFASADAVGDTARKLLKTSEIAAKVGALVAVNGTFFDTKRGGSVDFIKIAGRVLDTTRYAPGKALAEHQQAALVVRRRKVRVARGTSYGWEKTLKADNVMVTGPLLLWQGASAIRQTNAFNDNRHPRTCACVTTDKRLLLITVDGRTSQAYGMSLGELSFLSKILGCRDAVNFDGGGSTTMWIAGQPDSGVVNMPCDDKVFDHAGERAVSNVFLVRKKN
ncbi:MAG: phosphodiester glycosidase family protein [Cytophagaceae bacterium]|nr:phosphodiester glycosidase family protein [Cytophagaceae bacterium]